MNLEHEPDFVLERSPLADKYMYSDVDYRPEPEPTTEFDETCVDLYVKEQFFFFITLMIAKCSYSSSLSKFD